MIYAQFFVITGGGASWRSCRSRRCRGRTRGLRRLQPSSGDCSSGGRLVRHTKPVSRHDRRLAGGTVRRRDAGHDLPQLARRQDKRFEKRYPGSKVNITLMPINNDQFTAQIAGGVRLEAGAGRDAHLLGRLHDAVHAQLAAEAEPATSTQTPGLLRLDPERWDLSCLDLDCQDGNGHDLRASRTTSAPTALFYNKALFKKAGRRGAADDLRRAARRLRQVQGAGHHPDRLRRP